MADRSGYIGRAPGDSSVTVARQIFSPTATTTNFTFVSGYTVGYLDLFLNGTKLIEGVDYNATDTSTISLVSAAINGDVLEGVAYKAFNLGDKRIGIQSGGALIGNVDTLNFVGTGNTFALSGGTIDVSISGGGGGAGAGGTWSNYDGVLGVTTTKKVKIQNNLEVTGVTTSTGGFVGALTGNATGITGTPDITVRNITGVAATFTGVLTYEDVTNIDSVGLVTARSGINIVGGGLTVTGVSTFQNQVVANGEVVINGGFDLDMNGGGDLDLTSGSVIRMGTSNADNFDVFNNGSFSVIRDNAIGANGLLIDSVTKVAIQKNGTGNDSMAVFTVDGPVELYYNDALKLSTAGTGVTVTGRVDATSFAGDGSALTNLPASGITTAAGTAAGIVTTLFLSSAQDHKITASGITTITCSGGTEADSHTVRIINSGITTVGFSTFFLFPSGSTPSLPTASGAISLISFTVNRVGAGGTQLLAGASVNYS